jgi:hypothetical protein
VNTGTLRFHLDAGVGVTTSGGLVTHWADQSGNNNHFEQTAAGSRPALVGAGLNGLPSVLFTSDRLDAVGTGLNSGTALPITMFIVTSVTNNPFAAFDSAPGNANVFRYSAFNGVNPNNPTFAVELHDANPFVSAVVDPTGSVVSTQGFLNANLGGTRTLNNRVISDATLQSMGGHSGSTAQAIFSNPDIGTINGGGNGFYNGSISEILYYQGQLSVPDRFAVEQYLRGKYGVAGTLTGTQQLPNPTITAASNAFGAGNAFSGTFDVNLALDGNPNTDYASAGQAANTFIDFNFIEPTLISRVDYLDRQSSGVTNGQGGGGVLDNVTSFNLIFSQDATFGNGDDFIVPVLSPTIGLDQVVINGGAGFTAQFLRFDVTGVTPGASINQGAAEFSFFTNVAAVPEPASIALWSLLGCACLGTIAWRRRSK